MVVDDEFSNELLLVYEFLSFYIWNNQNYEIEINF